MQAELDNAVGKVKAFWNRPEGTTGKVFIVAILAAFGYAFYKLLPTLLKFTQDVLHLTILAIVLFAIFAVLLNKQFQTAVNTLFKMAMRALTGMVIKIDPVSIVKDYIDMLKRQSEKFEQQMMNVAGQIRNLKNIISKNKEDIAHQMELASQASKKVQAGDESYKGSVAVKTRQAARKEKSVGKYVELLSKLEMIYKFLGKYKQAADLVIEDKQNEVENAEIEYKTIKASYGAFKSAMSIIAGKNDKRAMFEQTMDYIAEEISMQVGEMERFAEVSEGFMKNMDLESGMYEEKGMEMLKKWEVNADSLLLKPTEKEIIVGNSMLDSTSFTIKPTADSGNSSYDKVFNKK